MQPDAPGDWFYLVDDMHAVITDMLPWWSQLSLALTCRALWARRRGSLQLALTVRALLRPRPEHVDTEARDSSESPNMFPLRTAARMLVRGGGMNPTWLLRWARRAEADWIQHAQHFWVSYHGVSQPATALSGLWRECARAGWPLQAILEVQMSGLRHPWYPRRVSSASSEASSADFCVDALAGYIEGGHLALFQSTLAQVPDVYDVDEIRAVWDEWTRALVAHARADFLPVLETGVPLMVSQGASSRLPLFYLTLWPALARALCEKADGALWQACVAISPGFVGYLHTLTPQNVRGLAGLMFEATNGLDHVLLEALLALLSNNPGVSMECRLVFLVNNFREVPTEARLAELVGSPRTVSEIISHALTRALCASLNARGDAALATLDWMQTRGWLCPGPRYFMLEGLMAKGSVSRPSFWLTPSACTARLYAAGAYDFTVLRLWQRGKLAQQVAASADMRDWLRAHPCPGSDLVLGDDADEPIAITTM